VITLSDDGSAIATQSAQPDGTYMVVANQSWSAGDTLAASATGDVVDMFGNTSVKAPETLSITAPPAVPIGVIPVSVATVSTSAALPVTWSGNGGTHVYITLTDTSGATLTCTTTDTGSFIVPEQSVAHFASSSYGGLLVTRSSEAPATCANATVTVAAATSSLVPVQFAP
jgi:hypothetical protein